jgi:TP901 family phage tail tape measure protein
MANDVNLNIGGNTRQLESAIQKTVNKSYSINLKTTGEQPLGRITSKVSEFNKSLEASNARVIAFGASAGVIFGLQSAFESLIKTTVEVQKSLADINVILNASESGLQKFGDRLFDIAKNTGQSFQAVAAAATEFSRQGLGFEETLKRTSDALILARLSGLDTVKSVEALTAAINSFASQAVTSTEIVNKFANVDAAFAVSSADLAEAISRVGSSAAQSGVNLNELIAIVTSAQQTTARGGAVIGNSFKTIFTRLQRGKVVDLLESLGVSTKDSEGKLKSTIQLLNDLANVYDSLDTLQQASVAERVGGVFQINILKAALADLGKEYSIYDRALQISATSTDQAITRNEKLNETYAAQLNALKQNAAQLAAGVGERVIGPSFNRVVGGANEILGAINESDGKGVGAALGRGILDGIGEILAGPGLALIGGVLIKLFKDFTVYASSSVKELLGLNNASKQQAEIQQSINSIIAQNPQLLQLMTQGTKGLNQAAEVLLNSFKQQTIELQKQDALTSKIASQLFKGGIRIQGGTPTATKTRATGYIPSFSKENRDIQRGVGGAKPSDVPIGPFNINGEPTIINSGEKLVSNFAGSGETAILTRDMQKSIPMADGYIPNFATPYNYLSKYTPDRLKKLISRPNTPDKERAAAQRELDAKTGPRGGPVDALSLLGFSKLPPILTPLGGATGVTRVKKNLLGDGTDVSFSFPSSSLQIKGNQKLQSEAERIYGDENFIAKFVDDRILPFTQELANTVGSPPADPKTTKSLANAKGLYGAIEGALGALFDASMVSAIGEASSEPDRGDFDVRATGKQFGYIDQLFPAGREVLGGRSNNLADFKKNASPDAADSMIKKVTKEYPGAFGPRSVSAKKPLTKANGYIPNFAGALSDSITRELDQSGLPKSQIYVSQKESLVDSRNPFGLGVFNNRDEGSVSKENRAIKNRSRGFIPNFAEESTRDISSSVGAVAIQLASLAVLFSSTQKSLSKGPSEFAKEIRRSNADLRNALATEIKARRTFTSNLALQGDKQLQGRLDSAKSLSLAGTAKATGRTAAGALKGGGGLGLGFGAQIIASTIKDAIPDTTKSGRVGGAAVGALGSAASGAALGSLILPGVGTAVGAVAGGLLGLVDVIKQVSTDLPELSAAAKRASQELTKTQEGNDRLLQAYQAYEDALRSGSGEIAIKTQKALAEELANATSEQRDAIKGAKTFAEAQAGLDKVLIERTKKEKEALLAESLSGVQLGRGPRIDSRSSLGSNTAFWASDPDRGIKPQDFEVVKTALVAQINSSTSDLDIKAGLSQQIRDKISTFILEAEDSLDPGEFRSSENLEKLVVDIEENIGSQLPEALRSLILGAKDLPGTFGLLEVALNEVSDTAATTQETLSSMIDPLEDVRAELAEKFVAAVGKASNAISSIIGVLSSVEASRDNLRTNEESFRRGLEIDRKIGGARSVAEQITGSDSMTSITLGLKESLARIEAGRRDEQSKTLNTLSVSLTKPITDAIQNQQEAIIKPLKEASTPQSVLDQAPDISAALENLGQLSEIIPSQISKLVQEASLADPGGGISTEVAMGIVDTIKSNLLEGGLSSESADALVPSLLTAVQNTNGTLAEINQNAKIQIEAIKDQTSRQLTAQEIAGALRAFGGIGEYIENAPTTNPFLEDKKRGISARTIENALPVRDAIDNISKIVSTANFRSNNPLAIRGRDREMPDLGREYLKLISFLKDRTGGLYSPEAGSGAIRAAEQGRTITIKDELRALESFLESTEAKRSPDATKEVRAAIDKIKSVGPEEIARIQVAQATGTLTAGDAQKVFDNASTRSTAAISEIAPELKSSIEGILASDNIVETSLQQLTRIEALSFRELGQINKALQKSVYGAGIGAGISYYDDNTPIDDSSMENYVRAVEGNTEQLKSQKSLNTETFRLDSVLDKQQQDPEWLDYMADYALAVEQQEATVAALTERLSTFASVPGALNAYAENVASIISESSSQTASSQEALTESQAQLTASVNLLVASIAGLDPSNRGGPNTTDTTQGGTRSTGPVANNEVNLNIGGVNITSTDSARILTEFDRKLAEVRSEIAAKLGDPKPPILNK